MGLNTNIMSEISVRDKGDWSLDYILKGVGRRRNEPMPRLAKKIQGQATY